MRILKAALLALAIPALASAQQQQPTPGGPMTTSFRGRTMTLQRNLAQAFDSIPEGIFNYKPTPAQLTIGYIAAHLASDNYLFCNQFGEQKATLADEDKVADSLKAGWPKAKLVDKLKASFAFCETTFAQLTDQTLTDMVTVTAPNGQSRQVLRMNYVLGHVIDMADHYSQIANYMRLNNILPPTALPRRQ